MKIEFAIEGTSQLKVALKEMAERVRPVAAAALYQEAEIIMAASKQSYVPVDKGVLRGSGVVNQPEVNGDEISVRMGYGGAATAYAAVQHERLDYKHKVGGPKFLERPILEASSLLAIRIAERVKRALAT